VCGRPKRPDSTTTGELNNIAIGEWGGKAESVSATVQLSLSEKALQKIEHIPHSNPKVYTICFYNCMVH
jgi:hypothetical protein